MDKVLIYLNENDLAPKGGPLGYNYNLRYGLSEIKEIPVTIEYIKGKSVSTRVSQSINTMKTGRIKKILSVIKSIANKGKTLYGKSVNPAMNLSDYSLIHFHQTFDMYKIRESLNEYNGIVVLTSHTPTKPSTEIYDRLSEFEKKYFKKFYKKLDIIDEYAFNRADCFIFPCEEAEEPYYNNWIGYEKIKEKKQDKYYYVPTGTKPIIAQQNRSDTRNRFLIPENAFVICYVGRHNFIKGYDDLLSFGKVILDKYDNVYFLIAGKEEPLHGLDHCRWIEVGWTNDPASIMNAADVCILPNKETYFDLIMLEILSLGKIVLASNTGGNKYFKKFSESGIYLYDNKADEMMLFEKIYRMTENEKIEKEQRNKYIYKQNFSLSVFSQSYIDTICTILKEIEHNDE